MTYVYMCMCMIKKVFTRYEIYCCYRLFVVVRERARVIVRHHFV